jgi:hypothetical protein
LDALCLGRSAMPIPCAILLICKSIYVRLLDNVAPEVSGLARAHRDGRGAENAPNGAMFTEGWFRPVHQ